MDPLHRFDQAGVVSPRQAGDDAQALARRYVGRFEDHFDARAVHRVGLFAEDVLAGVDGGLEVNRREVRRHGDEHHVDAASEQPLASVEADEPVVGVDGDLAGLDGGDLGEAAGDPPVEHVGHGHQLRARIGGERIGRRAGPASAAADQPHPQRLPAAGMDAPRERQASGHRRGGRCLEELTPRGLVVWLNVGAVGHGWLGGSVVRLISATMGGTSLSAAKAQPPKLVCNRYRWSRQESAPEVDPAVICRRRWCPCPSRTTIRCRADRETARTLPALLRRPRQRLTVRSGLPSP